MKIKKYSKFLKRLSVSIGFIVLGILGKILYDFNKENSNQSIQSWLIERGFQLFSFPLNHIESETLYETGVKLIENKAEDAVEIPHLDGINISDCDCKITIGK